jgi:hypothetical protein
MREVYLSKFAEEFNKTREALLQQINELEKEKFIKRKNEGKKVLFYINWSKITDEFYKFLTSKHEELISFEKINIEHYETKINNLRKTFQPSKLKSIEANFSKLKKEFKDFNFDEKREKLLKNKTKIINNIFLQGFFRRAFININSLKIYSCTIDSIFEMVVNRMDYLLLRENGNNIEFNIPSNYKTAVNTLDITNEISKYAQYLFWDLNKKRDLFFFKNAIQKSESKTEEKEKMIQSLNETVFTPDEITQLVFYTQELPNIIEDLNAKILEICSKGLIGLHWKIDKQNELLIKTTKTDIVGFLRAKKQ